MTSTGGLALPSIQTLSIRAFSAFYSLFRQCIAERAEYRARRVAHPIGKNLTGTEKLHIHLSHAYSPVCPGIVGKGRARVQSRPAANLDSAPHFLYDVAQHL